MLRVVLEVLRLLLELPYELLEDEELPPRCCDWPNAIWLEIASATLNRHVAANESLRMVEIVLPLACDAREDVPKT